jgi:hypothetical protein
LNQYQSRAFQLNPELIDFHRPEPLTPEATLLLAVIDQALKDATANRAHTRDRRAVNNPCQDVRLAAIEWLQCSPAVAMFGEWLGLDGEFLREQLCIRVGLSDARPRIGERIAPKPRVRRLYSPGKPKSTGSTPKKEHSHA